MKKKVGIGSALAALAAAAALVLTLSGAALALSFSANPVTLSSDDGQIASITVAPKINLEWKGLDQTPAAAVYEVYIKNPEGNWTVLASYRQASADFRDGGTTGNSGYTFAPIDIAPIYPYELLDADADGTTTTTDVSIKVKGKLFSGGSEIIKESAEDTFTVSCTNEPESLDIGGIANAVGTATLTE